MRKFEIGDLVKVKEKFLGIPGLAKGSTGTVCGFYSTDQVMVRWDLDAPNPYFHGCMGNCEKGYGYIVYDKWIELIECNDCELADVAFDDLYNLLNI